MVNREDVFTIVVRLIIAAYAKIGVPFLVFRIPFETVLSNMFSMTCLSFLLFQAKQVSGYDWFTSVVHRIFVDVNLNEAADAIKTDIKYSTLITNHIIHPCDSVLCKYQLARPMLSTGKGSRWKWLKK